MSESPTFGSRIREARERKGLTQAGLAAAAELTPSYVCLLESGRRRPPSDRAVRRLASALDLDPAEALRWAHLERAPRELRATVEDLRRRAERERALREQAAEALFPFSLWRFLPGGVAHGAHAQSLGADVVEFLDRMVEMARTSVDGEAFRARSRPLLDALPEDRRRRVLEAAPALLAEASTRTAEGGAELLVAAPPALPPDVLPGDSLVVRADLAPAAGDVIVVARSPAGATLARHAPAGPPSLGVVTEIRRPLRRAT